MPRRFEVMYSKPLRFWEVEVVECRVREWTEEGYSEQTFATTHDAATHAAAAITHRKAGGYFEIKKVASFDPDEPSVIRTERVDWQVGYVKRHVEIAQRDREVTSQDERYHTKRANHGSIADASKTFERWLVEARAHGAASANPIKFERSKELVDNPELEAACLAERDDRAVHAIYADWLIAQGDPRGEIAALALGGKRDDALGAFLEFFPGLNVELHLGFVRTYRLQASEPEALAIRITEELATPIARMVDRVELCLDADEAPGEIDWFDALEALAEARPTIRGLVLWVTGNTSEYHNRERRRRRPPSLGKLWPRFKELESLEISDGAGGNFGTFDLPALRHYRRETSAISRDELADLVAARLPRLHSLQLWLGSGEGIGLTELRPIIAGTAFPHLGHLGLVNSEVSDNLVPELVESPLLPKLYSLDLSKGVASETVTEHLERHAAHFRHLAMFDLQSNMLTDDEAARIRAVLDNVLVGEQREYPGDPEARYVETGE